MSRPSDRLSQSNFPRRSPRPREQSQPAPNDSEVPTRNVSSRSRWPWTLNRFKEVLSTKRATALRNASTDQYSPGTSARSPTKPRKTNRVIVPVWAYTDNHPDFFLEDGYDPRTRTNTYVQQVLEDGLAIFGGRETAKAPLRLELNW
jgi:hypothetical protein